jgi:four helix bundle suffix protein
MEQATRSGKQNISEGSQTSGTSKQSELRLVDVARASLEELLNDYKDFLRLKNLPIWSKDDARAVEIRALAYRENRTDRTYETYMTNAESATNCLLCLIHQTNYLLDQQLRSLEKDLREHGDMKERVKEYKKEKMFGNSRESDALYEKILKDAGKKRLIDGRIVDM